MHILYTHNRATLAELNVHQKPPNSISICTLVNMNQLTTTGVLSSVSCAWFCEVKGEPNIHIMSCRDANANIVQNNGQNCRQGDCLINSTNNTSILLDFLKSATLRKVDSLYYNQLCLVLRFSLVCKH
jgi:hypothetical protein